VWERFYFAAYTIATLGLGDFRPAGAGAQAATALAALTGLVLFTLAISYVTFVVSAVVGVRAFASDVFALGSTGAEAAAALVVDGTAGTTVTTVSALSGQLTTLAQQHRAYPLLHAFRARSPDLATAPAVGILVDTVVILSALTTRSARPPLALRKAVIAAASQYLKNAPRHVRRPEQRPPTPSLPLSTLAECGVGVDVVLLAERLAECDDIRRELAARIAGDGFAWPDLLEEDGGGAA
jgi:hypothetical protein